MQVYSLTLTLLICATTYSDNAVQSLTYVWDKHLQNFLRQGDMRCNPGSSPCILKVSLVNGTKCNLKNQTVLSNYYNVVKAVEKECSGKCQNQVTISSQPAINDNCDDDLPPFSTIDLKYECKPLGCKNNNSTKKEDEDDDGDNKEEENESEIDDIEDDDDDKANVTVIVASVAGIIATAILVSICAVLVCRVQRHVGWVQRSPVSKPQRAAGHTKADHGYDSIEIYHSTPSQVNPTTTTATTFTTELDLGVGDYCEITTASVSSIHSNHGGYVPSSPGSTSRTSSPRPETEGAKNPYAILERNRRNIPDPASDNIVGEPEPNKPGRVVSSDPASDINSSTLGANGSKFENGEEISIAVTLVDSEESLTRCNDSNENPSNQLYNTLDSVGGAYSHLKPIGAQKKIIANVYDG